MPIYEFRCMECSELFEKLFKSSDDKVDIECPSCKSAAFERVISRSNHIMGAARSGSKAKVTSKSCGSGSGCATLEIPGPDD